jgi:spermidine synthase
MKRLRLLAALVAGGALATALLGRQVAGMRSSWPVDIVLIGVVLVAYACVGAPRRFAVATGLALLASTAAHAIPPADLLYRSRSFFGALRVWREPGTHVLVHGGTRHGVQATSDAERRTPLSYYHRTGPLGDLFGALAPTHVAAVGLGTGTVAAYGRPGMQLTFYEIDPAVLTVARDPRYFTFLNDSSAEVRVVLGDARLRLREAPDGEYDLIILDAFSSDAIPVHLVTREAIELYLRKLRPGGVIASHISNRFLDLEPVLGNLAGTLGLASLVRDDEELEDHPGKSASIWVALARTRADLRSLASDKNWEAVETDPRVGLWSDDFSNLVRVIR